MGEKAEAQKRSVHRTMGETVVRCHVAEGGKKPELPIQKVLASAEQTAVNWHSTSAASETQRRHPQTDVADSYTMRCRQDNHALSKRKVFGEQAGALH